MAVFKKAGGRIFGVQFNAKEQRAIDKELLRQCAEYDRKNANEVDAIVLWLLHEKFGFGPKRLRAFYDYFKSDLSELLERYELGDEVRERLEQMLKDTEHDWLRLTLLAFMHLCWGQPAWGKGE
jgi:hypothetical protein